MNNNLDLPIQFHKLFSIVLNDFAVLDKVIVLYESIFHSLELLPYIFVVVIKSSNQKENYVQSSK